MKHDYGAVLLIFSCLSIAVFCDISPVASSLSMVTFDEGLPVMVYLRYQETVAEQARCFCLGLSSACGFVAGCIEAQPHTVSHIIGMSAVAATSCGLLRYEDVSERDWFMLFGAYTIGVCAGHLVRGIYTYCDNRLRQAFDKPEARVTVTRIDTDTA